MNIKRLREVQRVLRRVIKTDGHFDLADWYNEEAEKRIVAGERTISDVLHSCGTTACAIGFCALDSKFRDSGFHMTMNGIGGTPTPTYKGKYSFDAVLEYFELDWLGACYLFVDDNYEDTTDPQAVIDRIDEYIASGGNISTNDRL